MIGFNGKPLPCSECGGRCCKYAPIDVKTWEKVKHKAEGADITHHWEGTPKEAYMAIKPDTDGVCFFLNDYGRCSIYTYRPESCRGVGTKIPCAYVNPDAVMKMVLAARLTGHEFVADKKT